MLSQIFELHEEGKGVNEEVKRLMGRIRKTKTFIEVEKKNTRLTTIENKMRELKDAIMDDMKEKKIEEMIEQIDDKQYNLIIKNINIAEGKDIEFLDIQIINDKEDDKE